MLHRILRVLVFVSLNVVVVLLKVVVSLNDVTVVVLLKVVVVVVVVVLLKVVVSLNDVTVVVLLRVVVVVVSLNAVTRIYSYLVLIAELISLSDISIAFSCCSGARYVLLCVVSLRHH